MTEGLLPCWRCGNKDVQLCQVKAHYYVSCPECNTISPLFKASLLATKYWKDMYSEHKDEKEASHD
ncbi:MAG: hypothetical protein II832_06015 [Synergistaceae bacterium]|nr:hypothetical protein [Synergistaceae bacterium]